MIGYAFFEHLRVAAASGGKRTSAGRLNRPNRTYEKPSSSWRALRTTDARTAAGKSADRSIESAKVVLAVVRALFRLADLPPSERERRSPTAVL